MLKLSLSILALVLNFLALKYNRKFTYKTLGLIFSTSIVSLVVTGLLAIGLVILISDYGTLSIPLSYLLGTIPWLVFLRKRLVIRIPYLVLLFFLPLAYVGTYLGGEEIKREIEFPMKDYENNSSYARGHLIDFYSRAQEFKNACGRYPEKLKDLLDPVETCKKYEGYKELYLAWRYDRLIDPWGQPYQYKILNSDSIQIESLGADGRPGGTGFDSDIIISERPTGDVHFIRMK